MGRNGFPAADGVNTFVGFRFEVNFLCRYAERLRQRFAHFREMRAELWLLCDHHGVYVFYDEVFFVEELLCLLQKEQTVCPFPLRVRVRKMRADVAQTSATQ